ncbi:hypothetical protein G9P44_002347 [Scheffersomyces stipitis]|nr:hypothetical protein G9P44_002347 [Scheffersomyces stipitis]
MKKIFRKARSNSSGASSRTDGLSPRSESSSLTHVPRNSGFDPTPRRYTLPDSAHEVILFSGQNVDNEEAIEDENSLSPASSVALSETETLNYDRKQRFELQESYDENFTLYLPYLLRQMRLESIRQAHQEQNENITGSYNTAEEVRDTVASYHNRRFGSSSPAEHSNGAFNGNSSDNRPIALFNSREDTNFQNHTTPIFEADALDDDLSTVLDEPYASNDHPSRRQIMGKHTSLFNVKREYVIVGELMKSSNYVFPSRESFELFKQLRNNSKKIRKGSVITYDSAGTIRKMSNVTKEDIKEATSSHEVVDERNHLVPLEYKLKGLGMPLFRTFVPYLSSFKKNSPFMVFAKYREIPLKPVLDANGKDISIDKDTDPDNYETYPFCTVNSKFFQNVRRFIFHFHMNGEKPDFKVIMFCNNMKPYADFNYKGTRFRVIGPATTTIYLMSYNPNMRLLVIDDDQPSLCDNIINKRPGFELSSLLKKKKLPNKTNGTTPDSGISGPVKFDENNPNTFVNPYPNPKNPLIKELSMAVTVKGYVSNNLPPFGAFKDSMLYDNQHGLLPKKYNELAKVELYQDSVSRQIEDMNSTLSTDLDTQVLFCVMAVLREVSVRNSSRVNASGGVINRVNGRGGIPGFPSFAMSAVAGA